MPDSAHDNEVVSLEQFLVDTLDQFDNLDEWIHERRSALAARLRALQIANDPALRERLEVITQRLRDGELPPIDDPNFLQWRLAEIAAKS
jgi:hypothetical protein